ncbi:MAG: hypothetical protein R8G34_22075 [Paracoccaceae bacterium]|nr:hypothetical protein [Paracoccaceae bacterium]MDW3225545.1 hypothetical protein [Paracoccaceae bacterium]
METGLHLQRARAGWLLSEHPGACDSQSAVIKPIALKGVCRPDMLSAWGRRAETDSGQRDGMRAAEGDRIGAFKRENRQFRQASEVLNKGTPMAQVPVAKAYFAPALITAGGDCRAARQSATVGFGKDRLYQRTSRALWGRAGLPGNGHSRSSPGGACEPAIPGGYGDANRPTGNR